MIQSPGILLTLLAFVLVIGPLVFIHEVGHYLAGRLFRVKADTFAIGFGREVAGWTDKRGTRWKVGWLPLGGYVKFAGDMNAVSQPSAEWLALPAEERNATFQAKPVWQRAVIVAAGPFVNFVAAILILTGFALAFGDLRGPAVAGEVISGSPAAAAGIRSGDRIDTVDGKRVQLFTDLAAAVHSKAGKPVMLGVAHGDAFSQRRVVVGHQTIVLRDGRRQTVGLLGIKRAPVSLFEAPLVGVRQTGEIVALMSDAIRQIVVGQRPFNELGGPLQIAQVSGQQFAVGVDAFVFLIALVSINLGFINLLPVPMLDGGHLMFYAIEAVRQKPVGPEAQEWAYRGGFAAVVALMLAVTFNDLGNFGVWRGLAGLVGAAG